MISVHIIDRLPLVHRSQRNVITGAIGIQPSSLASRLYPFCFVLFCTCGVFIIVCRSDILYCSCASFQSVGKACSQTMKRHSKSTTSAGRAQLCLLYDVHVNQSRIGLRVPAQPHFAFMRLLMLPLQQSKPTTALLLQLLQPR
jgi:hypothetical protein